MRRHGLDSTIAAVVLYVCVSVVVGDHKTHRYAVKDEVPLYVNKIGPYANPSETYEYYTLPFCTPEHIQHKHASLGERLDGDVMESSVYDLRFGVDIKWQAVCKVHLGKEEIRKFQKAITKNYYFEFVYDDLPMWGFIGTLDAEPDVDGETKTHFYLYTHLHFEIEHNAEQVIHVNVTSDPTQMKEIIASETQVVEFSYSAKWTPTDVPFKHRRKVYTQYSFFPRELEIHWLSIINSFVLVILLTGFLAIILVRVLKNDLVRYSKLDEESDEQDDYGWKLVHGDVFRFPPQKSLFASLVGIGAQILTVGFCILGLALVGVFYPYNHGSMYSSSLILYPITSVISGYTSASLYKKMGGQKWVWNIALTITIFALPGFLVSGFLNTVATIRTSSMAVPFITVAGIVFVWAAVGIPLTLLGGIAGRNLASPFQSPCRTKNVAREIPHIPWYRRAPVQMLMAGFLPFSAIYIELYYIFASVWGHKPYTLYGILALVFLILLIVTACITVALTYFQLAMEDYRWWWRSFFCGGSTSLFVFAYSIFYYYYRSDMSGFQQTVFYFGYMFIFCYAFFIMLGTVGFVASLTFVKRIYQGLKVD
eukprot:TRINITY_DN14542_c0_g1_i1.p1 TRINITY_DN14542_c0_g1~~TRINITY_DN14542_c0_g1_i1.p1  ORF type:complete len:594 (+),score=123.19 TRINITY_DN14542_c0_g1_i1:59-1840(+)